MYQLVCGDFPFSGESVAELIMKINFRDFTKLDRAQKFSCPKLLQQMIDKCLEKPPEKRLSISECLDILTKLAVPDEAPKKIILCKNVPKKIDNASENDGVDFGGLGF